MNVCKKLTTQFFFCCVFILGIGANATAVNLSAEVDRNTISMNESLRLVVAIDEAATESIDFSQLETQFEIINQQRSQRSQIINGSVSAITQWILILAPREQGNLLIPSFRYKNVFSNPIEIIVDDAPQQTDGSAEDVFLEITADKSEVFVQEQVLLKTRLYYKVSLSSYEAPEFQLKDTNIELVNESTYKTSFNNERYQVLELIHALFPQASGELVIPQLRWRLEKPSRGFFDRSGNPYLFVQSNEIAITVKPIPKSSTAEHWLPSEAVTINGEWQQSPLQAEVGEPLNLTLTLTANGLSAAQLPEMTISDNNKLQVFSEPSTGEDIESGNGIIGTRTSTFAIIPQTTGSIELPEITLKWWNVSLGREQVASLPPQRLVVAASQIQPQSLPSLPELNATPSSIESTSKPHASFWQAISLLLIIFCSALCYWIYRLKQSAAYVIQDSDKINNPPAHLFSIRTIENHIEQAISEQHSSELPALVVQWAKIYFDDKKIRTAHDIQPYMPALSKELMELNRYLYSDQSDHNWNADSLLTVLKHAEKNHAKAEKTDGLKPLYPS